MRQWWSAYQPSSTTLYQHRRSPVAPAAASAQAPVRHQTTLSLFKFHLPVLDICVHIRGYLDILTFVLSDARELMHQFSVFEFLLWQAIASWLGVYW